MSQDITSIQTPLSPEHACPNRKQTHKSNFFHKRAQPRRFSHASSHRWSACPFLTADYMYVHVAGIFKLASYWTARLKSRSSKGQRRGGGWPPVASPYGEGSITKKKHLDSSTYSVLVSRQLSALQLGKKQCKVPPARMCCSFFEFIWVGFRYPVKFQCSPPPPPTPCAHYDYPTHFPHIQQLSICLVPRIFCLHVVRLRLVPTCAPFPTLCGGVTARAQQTRDMHYI